MLGRTECVCLCVMPNRVCVCLCVMPNRACVCLCVMAASHRDVWALAAASSTGRKRASEIGGRVSALVDVDVDVDEARLANRRREDDYVR